MKIEPITAEPTAKQLMIEQRSTLRWASMCEGERDCERSPRSRGGALCSGSSIIRQIRTARIRPGMPAMKNASRQPQISASQTSTIGANAVPSSEPNTFCTTPALRPLRCSAEAATMIARQIGRNGPSAAPITSRAANSEPKFHARPESTEQKEKITNARQKERLARADRIRPAPERNRRRAPR